MEDFVFLLEEKLDFKVIRFPKNSAFRLAEFGFKIHWQQYHLPKAHWPVEECVLDCVPELFLVKDFTVIEIADFINLFGFAGFNQFAVGFARLILLAGFLIARLVNSNDLGFQLIKLIKIDFRQSVKFIKIAGDFQSQCYYWCWNEGADLASLAGLASFADYAHTTSWREVDSPRKDQSYESPGWKSFLDQ